MRAHVGFLQRRYRRIAERHFSSISRAPCRLGRDPLEATPPRGESLPLAGDIEQNARPEMT
jgi:hypothetical protein